MAQAKRLVAEGADIIDIGAKSTRPGHEPVPADVEQARLAPLLRDVVECIEQPVSIDTSKASVARFAAAQGVAFINDVWGLQRDPAMADVVAETGTGVVIMHNREAADPACDIIADMRRFFDRSLELARKAGVPAARIMLDPGIGFAKSGRQNLQALQGLGALKDYGLPNLRRPVAQVAARRGCRRRADRRDEDRAPPHRDAGGEPRRGGERRVDLPRPRRGGTCRSFKVFDAIRRA